MENNNFQWVNPLFLWVIFNSYVNLPEGSTSPAEHEESAIKAASKVV